MVLKKSSVPSPVSLIDKHLLGRGSHNPGVTCPNRSLGEAILPHPCRADSFMTVLFVSVKVPEKDCKQDRQSISFLTMFHGTLGTCGGEVQVFVDRHRDSELLIHSEQCQL